MKWSIPLAVLGVLAAHALSLGNGFVDFDDPVVFLNNPLLQRNDWGALADIFSFDRRNWRPLRDLSHWLDYLIHGQTPFWAHFHNWILTGLTAGMCATAFRRFGLSAVAAAAIAFLALIHPVNVEAVSWITGRKELLAGLSFFAMIWAFGGVLRGAHPVRWGLMVVVMFTLGIMAKGHIIVAPAVLFLLAWRAHLKQPLERPKATLILIGIVGILAVAAIPLIARGDVMMTSATAAEARFQLTIGDRIQIPLRYLRLLAWPVDLNHIYLTATLDGWHLAWTIASGIFIAAWLALAALWLKRRDPRGPILLIPLVIMAPYLHIMPGVVYMADRYLFLIVPFVVWVLVETVGPRLKVRQARLVVFAIGLGWVASTALEHLVWHDSVSLWTRMTEVYPQSDWGFDRLGQAQYRRQNFKDATIAYMQASERAPRKTRHLNNAAVSLMAAQKFGAARALLEQAQRINPTDPRVQANLKLLSPR